MPSKVTDHLANERTFLAWIRTALGLIGLGFVLARMGLFLRQFAVTAQAQHAGALSALTPPKALHTGHEFIVAGVVFLVIGTVLGGWSGWAYDRNRKAIETDRFNPARTSVSVVTGVVVAGSLAIVGLVVWRMVVEG